MKYLFLILFFGFTSLFSVEATIWDINKNNANWSDSGNWTNGIPDATKNAQINLDSDHSTKTINNSTNIAAKELSIISTSNEYYTKLTLSGKYSYYPLTTESILFNFAAGPIGRSFVIQGNLNSSASLQLSNTGVVSVTANITQNLYVLNNLTISHVLCSINKNSTIRGNLLISNGGTFSTLQGLLNEPDVSTLIEGDVILTGTSTFTYNLKTSIPNDKTLTLEDNSTLYCNNLYYTGTDARSAFPLNFAIINSGGIIQIEKDQTFACKKTVSGTGDLHKTGKGTLILDNADTCTGTTVIEEGTLQVSSSGSINPAKITVNQGAILEDNGTITCASDLTNTGNIIGNGTIIIPNPFKLLCQERSTITPQSNSPGKLTIQGDLSFQDNSNLFLYFNILTGSELEVSGTIDIGNNVHILPMPENTITNPEDIILFFQNGVDFLFVDGGTLTGAFADIECPYPGFQFSIIENGNGNELTLNVETLPLASLVFDPNQISVANVFDQEYSSQSPDFLRAHLDLYFLELPALQNALNQLHPALFNGIALAQEETTTYITKILSQRLEEITWKNPNLKEKKWNLWGQGLRDYARQQGKKNLRGYHATTPGIIIGADVKIYSNFSFGLEGSYTNTHIGWEAHQGYGHTSTGYGGLYGSWYNQNFLVGLSLIGGWNSTKATRSIEYGEIERSAHHRQHGWEIAPQLELAGLYEMKYISFQPFLKESYVYLHQNHYREHGAESLNLDVQSKNADLLRSELGLGLFHCFKGKQLQFTPELKGSYILESRFQGKKTTAYFMNNTFERFTVKGLSPSRSLGHLGVLFKGSSYNGFDLTLDYNFLFGKKYRDHKMALRFDYAF
ncbi:MAG: autotransporter domain-containing protein [Chlamydiota bacterium]